MPASCGRKRLWRHEERAASADTGANRRAVRGNPSSLRGAGGGGGIEPLPLLLRRSVYGRVSNAYRRAALHQEDLDGKFARVGRDDSRFEHSWPKLFAGVPGRRVV